MKPIGISASSTGPFSRAMRGIGLAVAMAITVPSAVSASSAVDAALLQIEQVEPRLSGLPSVVEGVAKAAASQGNAEAPKAVPMLQSALLASFDVKSMGGEMSKDLAEVDDGKIDTAALTKASAAFEEGRRKVLSMYEQKDQAAAKEIESRLDSADDGPQIRQLADLMASPELAAETALTTQVIYASIEAFADPNTVEIAAVSEDKLKIDMQGVAKSLRGKTENEKPVPKDVARAEAKARLTFILATLPKDDLSALAGFYQSAEGKAKKQALVDGYRSLSDEANTNMLVAYFTALADYFKSNPRPQQQ